MEEQKRVSIGTILGSLNKSVDCEVSSEDDESDSAGGESPKKVSPNFFKRRISKM